jgi:hypothetical protein
MTLDLRLGKQYYVECIIHHKVYKASPELKLIPEDAGKENFENIL